MEASADDIELDLVTAPEPGAASLSQQAYLRLREQIVTLRRAPGAPLSMPVLAHELGLGRTPLREALQRLACQGLVEIRPRQGAFVASVEFTHLQRIFELRLLLEGHAAGLAAARATRADLAALQLAIDRLARLHPQHDAVAHIEVDRAFHAAVAAGTHNPYLRSTLEQLYNLNVRLWYLVLDQLGSMRAAVEQHQATLAAIVDGDAARAEAAMRRHIADFQERVRSLI
jgi:DNA-binding GntR family transcriptional regulator